MTEKPEPIDALCRLRLGGKWRGEHTGHRGQQEVAAVHAGMVGRVNRWRQVRRPLGTAGDIGPALARDPHHRLEAQSMTIAYAGGGPRYPPRWGADGTMWREFLTSTRTVLPQVRS